MHGQATPEERERADERKEAAEIKRLDAKAKTATTQAERQASANEAKRLRLTRDIRGANGRLDRAQARSRDLSRGIANSNAEASQAQKAADAITGTDEKSKARKTELEMQAQNALTRAQQGEAEKKFADKTVNRITDEISDYKAQLRQLPAKAD
jgi:chromosome segregation ATPase